MKGLHILYKALHHVMALDYAIVLHHMMALHHVMALDYAIALHHMMALHHVMALQGGDLKISPNFNPS